ncbi:hypothetical protein ACVXG7_18935 [Enterobacter hormaechei]
MPEYASELHLTESRLTDICRRFANRSPKRLDLRPPAAGSRDACCCFPTARSAKLPGSWVLNPAYFAVF